MSWLDTVFKRNKEIDWMYDMEFIADKSRRTYLKKLAIQICVNHIADTISQSDFKMKNNDEEMAKHIEYLLNVRPNKNQNASQFWQQVIYKLINDNEVLIIQTDTDELVIASDFVKEDMALYDAVFKNVRIGEFMFKRNFLMSDVIYMEYSNGQMKDIIDGLFGDYGEIFGRLVNHQLHANQLRATFMLGTAGRKDKEAIAKHQSFLKKLTRSINEDPIAIVPIQDGQEYKEHSSGINNSQSASEVTKVLNGFIDKVAMALRIPVSLLYGEMADTKQASRNYMRFCINPLIKQISDEFTSKLFEREDIESNNHKLEIRPMSLESIFDRSEAIDKLVSSGTFNRNELREELGKERGDDPELDKFLITKNYQTTDEATQEE